MHIIYNGWESRLLHRTHVTAHKCPRHKGGCSLQVLPLYYTIPIQGDAARYPVPPYFHLYLHSHTPSNIFLHSPPRLSSDSFRGWCIRAHRPPLYFFSNSSRSSCFRIPSNFFIVSFLFFSAFSCSVPE